MCERGLDPLILITNYETIQKDYEDKESPLFKTHWQRILLDEAHIARNPKTNTYHALKNLKANSKWCITGTPIVNYPDDIRRLSQLCTPAFPLNYGSSLQESRWKSLFLLRRTKEMLPLPPMVQQDVWLELSEEEKKNYANLESWAQEVYDELVSTHTLNQKYQKILLVLVRLRQACDHLLLQEGYTYTSKMLEIVKQKYHIEDAFSKKKDDEAEQSDEDEFNFIDYDDSFDRKRTSKKKRKNDIKSNGSNKKPKANDGERDFAGNDRQIVILDQEDHESIFTPSFELLQKEEERKKETELIEQKLMQATDAFQYSTKLNFIKQFVQQKFQIDPNAKIVIFTQFTTMLDLIEITLIKENIKTLRFDGRVQKAELRKKIIELFTVDPQYKVYVSSYVDRSRLFSLL